MKKILPYILILVVLLIAGGVYLQYSKGGKPLLNVSLRNPANPEPEPTPKDETQLFTNHGPAPELAITKNWLNSDPLTMQQLRGKVVLIDFWTYSCINCIRTLPYITKWYDKYKDQGLVIIGVHTPEFAFEKVKANVETALKRYGITYPVVQDNDYKTWRAYNNQFWPAHYLIDKDGNIVYTHFGEGNYETTEKAIRTLLGLEGAFEVPAQAEVNKAQTPEIYFGLTRLQAFGGLETPSTTDQIFVYPEKLAKNKFALEGNWQFTQEAAIHTKGFGRIKLHFNSAKVFIVAQSDQPTTIKVYVDGQLIKGVVVKESQLYELFSSNEGKTRTMEIEVPDAGFEAFTFTFG